MAPKAGEKMEAQTTTANSGKDEGVSEFEFNLQKAQQPQPPKIFDSTLGYPGEGPGNVQGRRTGTPRHEQKKWLASRDACVSHGKSTTTESIRLDPGISW